MIRSIHHPSIRHAVSLKIVLTLSIPSPHHDHSEIRKEVGLVQWLLRYRTLNLRIGAFIGNVKIMITQRRVNLRDPDHHGRFPYINLNVLFQFYSDCRYTAHERLCIGTIPSFIIRLFPFLACLPYSGLSLKTSAPFRFLFVTKKDSRILFFDTRSKNSPKNKTKSFHRLNKVQNLSRITH